MATRKKVHHSIARVEVQVLLTRRLINGVDSLSRGDAEAVAAYLLDSKQVTPATMFSDDVALPQDHGVKK